MVNPHWMHYKSHSSSVFYYKIIILIIHSNTKLRTMAEVDPAFIRPVEHRPKLTIIEAEGIPVIDLSAINSSDPNVIAGLVAEIGNACKNWGFFQVINHGVPTDIFRKLETVAREFFAQPMEEKVKVRRSEVSPNGYFESEHTKKVRDWKEMFDFMVHEPLVIPVSPEPDDKEVKVINNQWPQHPPELREISEEYAREVEKLSYKLLELISQSLGLAADRLSGFFKNQSSTVLFNYYPPCPVPNLALGAGPHKDSGALTVLAQDDVGGLEVRRQSDGEWVRVKPTPNVYTINVGDIIQVWSNDKYESVEHRVIVNSEKDRFSIPFFFSPAPYTAVEPLEELINEQNPAGYRPYIYGKFIANRSRSYLKKQGVESIQLHHFRVSANRGGAGNLHQVPSSKATCDENF